MTRNQTDPTKEILFPSRRTSLRETQNVPHHPWIGPQLRNFPARKKYFQLTGENYCFRCRYRTLIAVLIEKSNRCFHPQNLTFAPFVGELIKITRVKFIRRSVDDQELCLQFKIKFCLFTIGCYLLTLKHSVSCHFNFLLILVITFTYLQ